MKYKINELSKILGVTSTTLRRYEKNGYLSPERDPSDYRWYKESDIPKTAQIRLLRKCGFSHDSIEKMLGASHDDIREIRQNKLDEIDMEIHRLKNLRHWLKDNIQMMDTIKSLNNGFMLMDCPAIRYIIYCKEGKLLLEPERLKTINDFMYSCEEVQQIQLYRSDPEINKTRIENNNKDFAYNVGSIFNKRFSMYKGWAIKEMDIERLGLNDMVENNKYITVYPSMKCLYGLLSIPTEAADDEEKRLPYFIEFMERKEKYLKENGMNQWYDVVVFIVNVLGDMQEMLVCMPVSSV